MNTYVKIINECCGNCRFRKVIDKVGVCRLHPPQYIKISAYWEWEWPPAYNDSWCGDYEGQPVSDYEGQPGSDSAS